MLRITDLNTRSLVERSLTVAMSYISSASAMLVLTESAKIDQSEGIPGPGILERPFNHRSSLASSRRAFLYFFAHCFLRCTLLTGRLEEANHATII